MVVHDVRPTVRLLLARNAVHGKHPQSMRGLARLLGLDPSAFNRRLAGKKGGSGVTMEQVATIIGCTVEDIYTGGRL